MNRSLQLFLFTTDETAGQVAKSAGIDGVVIDWENAGKERRQEGFDTEINHDTAEDLKRMAHVGIGRVLCRLNGLHPGTREEVESAIQLGATDILLPMITGAAEAEALCEMIGGRVRAGVLIEREEAVRAAAEIARTGIDLVYVGLNDLRISRQARSIFEAIVDGTVERIRENFCDQEFGFGGLTVLDAGQPVRCMRLLEEMARLDSDFTFLRRSFKRDILHRNMKEEISAIRLKRTQLYQRNPGEIDRDRNLFAHEVEAIFTRSLR